MVCHKLSDRVCANRNGCRAIWKEGEEGEGGGKEGVLSPPPGPTSAPSASLTPGTAG